MGRLDYDRWNFRAGVNANIGKWNKASFQISGDMGEQNNARNGISGGGTDADFNSLMTHLPFVPDYYWWSPVVYYRYAECIFQFNSCAVVQFQSCSEFSG